MADQIILLYILISQVIWNWGWFRPTLWETSPAGAGLETGPHRLLGSAWKHPARTMSFLFGTAG
jgi:hypothetical protein